MKTHELPEWKEMMRLFQEWTESEQEYIAVKKKAETAKEKYDESVEVYLKRVGRA